MTRTIKVCLEVVCCLLLGLLIVIGVLISIDRWLMHKGTEYSGGFSKSKWKQVVPGVTKREVWDRLGPPLNKEIKWDYPKGEEEYERYCWTYPIKGNGYFNCMWFNGDTLVRKQSWEDD